MGDRFPLFFLGGLLLAGSLGAFVFRAAERSEYADTLSTYRSSPKGGRALYLVSEELGVPVRRHQTDLEILPAKGALILLGVRTEENSPLFGRTAKSDDDSKDDDSKDEEEDGALSDDGMNFFTPALNDDEEKKVLEYVKAGSTVVYAPRHVGEDALLKAVGFSIVPAKGAVGIRTLVPPQPSAQALGVERVEARVEGWLDYSEHAMPLLVDSVLGKVVAASAPYGAGRLVAIAAPELAMNEALGRADNAAFWMSLLRASAGEGEVHFDEYHHGFSDDRSIAQFALRYRLHLAVAQLLLGLAFWGAALRRFGRPRRPRADEREGGLDALLATSRLYREGHHDRYAAHLIAQGLAQELAPSAGLPARATPEEVAAGLQSRGLPELAAGLAEVSRLAQAAENERAVERVARAAAEARARILQRRRTRARRTDAAAHPRS